MRFLEQAERDDLPQGSLESLEFQTSLLANLGEGNEDALVADFVEQIGTLEDYMNEAVSAWREGDIGRIDESLLTDMAEQFPEDFAAMFTRRNRNWVPQIMAMLDDADTGIRAGRRWTHAGGGRIAGVAASGRRNGASPGFAGTLTEHGDGARRGPGSGTGFVTQNDLARAACGSLATYPGGDLLYFSAGFQKVRDMLGQVFPAVVRGYFFLRFTRHQFPTWFRSKRRSIH